MRIFIICSLILTMLLSAATSVSFASAIPSTITTSKIIPAGDIYKNIATLKLKDLRKLTGRKLTFKEKIAFLILKHKLKHKSGDKQNQGQASFVFGLVALGLLIAGLFIPYVILGSLVASIFAIVTGSMAKKQDSSDRKAQAGKLLGWITLGLIALLFILAAIVLASWSFI